eukprot:GHVP01066461.1.p1 GENE.GHVP01066461.1~~GHVP01066461.1.p1  ORF type:complete len:213 (+),score=25.93 GHVP01066461.1:333-971(+)
MESEITKLAEIFVPGANPMRMDPEDFTSAPTEAFDGLMPRGRASKTLYHNTQQKTRLGPNWERESHGALVDLQNSGFKPKNCEELVDYLRHPLRYRGKTSSQSNNPGSNYDPVGVLHKSVTSNEDYHDISVMELTKDLESIESNYRNFMEKSRWNSEKEKSEGRSAYIKDWPGEWERSLALWLVVWENHISKSAQNAQSAQSASEASTSTAD